MATYTKEQVIKWNGKASNGFKLDLTMLLYHNQKELQKTVMISDTKKITYSLDFRECRQNYRFSHYEIKLTKSIWNGLNSGMWSTMGLGYSVKINTEKYAKKNFNELCKVSETLTDELINLLFNEVNDIVDNGHGVVIASPKE